MRRADKLFQGAYLLGRELELADFQVEILRSEHLLVLPTVIDALGFHQHKKSEEHRDDAANPKQVQGMDHRLDLGPKTAQICPEDFARELLPQ